MSGAASPRRAAKRLDSIEVVYQIAQLTVRRSLRGWRLVAAACVIALPCALAWLVRAQGANAAKQEEFFYGILSYYQFGIAIPVVAMLFATAFPWPEAQEGTLTYWFTMPVRRWAVLLGRYVAALLIGSVLLPLAIVALAASVRTEPQAELLAVSRSAITATLLVYPAYLALFQLVAVVFRQGLIFGVVFVIIENLVSSIPGSIVRLTLIVYVRSMLMTAVPKASQTRAAAALNVIEPATTLRALIVFAAVTVVALGLSLILVERIEYRGRTSQPG